MEDRRGDLFLQIYKMNWLVSHLFFARLRGPPESTARRQFLLLLRCRN